MKTYAILAAGGSGTRMQADRNKIFLQIGRKTVLERSISLFDGLIDGMIIVCRSEDLLGVESICEAANVSFGISTASGGVTRQESVRNGLHALSAADDDIILIHDAARCLTPASVISGVIESCRHFGSGVPGISAVSTMKYVSGSCLSVSVDRTDLYEIQTPQGFRFDMLKKAYQASGSSLTSATDDSSVVMDAGFTVQFVKGSKQNIKITEKEDLQLVDAILSEDRPQFRTGMGYDVHRLTGERDLILCGVHIPYPLGLLGHSDADVAVHALMDALLGAVALGDIGRHFPDTSDQYKGISSLILLKKTYNMVTDAGYELVNADITIVAQKPKLAPFISEMIKNISETIPCNAGQINIKATTTEKLGFEGREEGISAQAVCLVKKRISG